MFQSICVHFVPGSESETINHLFFECSFTSQLWKEFETFWSLLSRKRVDLLLQDVLLDKLDEGTDLLNYFKILLKLDIWVSRKQNVHPNLNVFKETVKAKFRTEK